MNAQRAARADVGEQRIGVRIGRGSAYEALGHGGAGAVGGLRPGCLGARSDRGALHPLTCCAEAFFFNN